jgi:hypothetical protein
VTGLRIAANRMRISPVINSPVIRKRAAGKSVNSGCGKCGPASMRWPAHMLRSCRCAQRELLAPFCARPAAAPVPLCCSPGRCGHQRRPATAGRARLLASAAAAASRVPRPVWRVAFVAPFLRIGMCISNLRVNHILHRISDGCALAGPAGRGSANWQTIAGFGVPGRRVHAMTGNRLIRTNGLRIGLVQGPSSAIA